MSLYAFIYVNVLSNPTLFLVDHPVSFGNMSHYESKMGCEQQILCTGSHFRGVGF